MAVRRLHMDRDADEILSRLGQRTETEAVGRRFRCTEQGVCVCMGGPPCRRVRLGVAADGRVWVTNNNLSTGYGGRRGRCTRQS